MSFLSEGFVPQMEDGTCAAPRSKSRRALQAFLLPSHEIEALHKTTQRVTIRKLVLWGVSA